MQTVLIYTIDNKFTGGLVLPVNVTAPLRSERQVQQVAVVPELLQGSRLLWNSITQRAGSGSTLHR